MAFINSLLVLAVLVLFSTEILSLFKILTASSVELSWMIFTFMSFYIFYNIRTHQLKTKPIKNDIELEKILLSLIAFFCLFGLIQAIWIPPNSYDSMDYHLPRVMHWIQNQSVAHYATGSLKQLYMPPFGEFCYLHSYLLGGWDYFVNSIQWIAFVGYVVAVSLIAKTLGGNKKAQTISAFITATIPMGLWQLTSADNDNISAFFVTVAVFYILRNKRILMLSVAFGLALLTKSTSYFYLFPFGILFLLNCIKSKQFKPLIILISITLLINSGHFYRNLELFNSPFGDTEDNRLRHQMEWIAPQAIAVNILKNVALHLQTPLPSINQMVVNSITNFSNFLGVDIDDKRISPRLSHLFKLQKGYLGAGLKGASIHIFLIIFSVGIVFSNKRYKKLRSYTIGLLLGFLLFCSLVKWYQSHSRLHLIFFVLSSVPIGIVLSELKKKTAIAIVSIVLIYGVQHLLWNENIKHSLAQKTRFDRYFWVVDNNTQNIYQNIIADVKNSNCNNIVFDGQIDFEYVIWTGLKKQNPKIKYINVDNISRKKQNPQDFNPCYRISPIILSDEKMI